MPLPCSCQNQHPDRVLRDIPLPCRVPELLQVAEAHVPHGLVYAAAWERLRSISDPLPPVAFEGALECRLEAEGEPGRLRSLHPWPARRTPPAR